MNPMNRMERFTLLLLLLIFLFLLIRTAWVGDDVFITLRTVDNFIHGYGLRWNISDRVQSYTHPLWMLMMIPLYAILRNGYLTAVLLSFLFTIPLILWIAFKSNIRPIDSILTLTLLLLSKAF